MAQEKSRKAAFRSMNVNSQSQLLNSKIKELQKKIKILESSNSELIQENQKFRQQISQKSQIENKNSQLQSQNCKLNDKIKQYQQKLRNVQKQKQETQKTDTLKDPSIDNSIQLKQLEIKLKQNEERVKRIQKIMKDWKIKALGLQMDLTKEKQQHKALSDKYKEQIYQYKEKVEQINKLQNEYKSKIQTLSKQLKQQKNYSIPQSSGQSERFGSSDPSSQLKLELGKISGQLEKAKKLLNERENQVTQLKSQRQSLFEQLKKNKEQIQSLNSKVTELQNKTKQHRFGQSLNSRRSEIEDNTFVEDNNTQLKTLLQNSDNTIQRLKKTISEQDEQLDKKIEINGKLELQIQRLKKLMRSQEFYIDKLKTEHQEQLIKSRAQSRNLNSTWNLSSTLNLGSTWNVSKNAKSQNFKEQISNRQNKGYYNESKNKDIEIVNQKNIIEKDQQQQ